uniref:CSON011686 protein n=1 Tax=Culicoides sonorensis TaxID=179676 RepID=A0A336M5T0_CULSO
MCDDQNLNEAPYTITANCLDMPKLPKTNDTVNTRDLYQCVNVPKRYESSNFHFGYGIEKGGQNPIYRTSNSEYGYYKPDIHTVPHRYFPQTHNFTEHLHKCGMYRNYGLNTAME